MAVEVVMPKFGLTMHEGTIQQWFRREGERIEAGEPLFEVETEKVLYEVEAPATGVVAMILYPPETTVPVATVLSVIAEAGEDPAEVAARYRQEGEKKPGTPPPSTAVQQAAAPSPSIADGRRRAATPAARKLARDRGIDLSKIGGSGPGGRITREDVEAELATPRASLQGEPLRGMRKQIATRMLESLHTTAQLTITTEADVTSLVELRRRLQAQFPITYTDLIACAAAAALRQHPRINSTVDAHQIVTTHAEIHIGVAVALDDGLIVPVIRDADRKSLRELAEQTRALAERARAGTLAVDEVRGGTFTITNLGTYGIDAFTPILHLPQVAILGVGRVIEKPAVHEGVIAIRHRMTLSLTFDHRIVDGAPAAAFLQSVVQHFGRVSEDS